MEIKYKNTFDDYVNCVLLCEKLKLSRVIIGIITKYLFPLWGFYMLVFVSNNIKEQILIAIFIILWIGFFSKIFLRKVKYDINNQIKNSPSMLEEKTIILKNDNIILIRSDLKKEIEVKSIKDIVDKNNIIYIFKNQYKIFAMIPHSAFKDDHEKNIFLKNIKGLS